MKSRVRRERPDVGVCGRMSRAWPRCARSVFLFVGVTMVDEMRRSMPCPVSCVGDIFAHAAREGRRARVPMQPCSHDAAL